MAVAETVTIGTEDVGQISADQFEKFAISIPDVTSEESIDVFKSQIIAGEHAGVVGVINVKKRWKLYRYHTELASQAWDRMLASINRINGVRSVDQKHGDKKRSLRATAQSFYEALSTSGLRMHCTLFNLDYNVFESQEDVISALVNKHVEMVNQ